MVISKKTNSKYVLKSLLFIAFGGVFLFGSYLADEYLTQMYLFVILLASFFLIAKGVYHLFQAKNCRLDKSHTFEIRDEQIYFDDTRFSLKDSFIFIELSLCDSEKKVVTAFLETNNQTKTIFQDIVFTNSEYDNFLSIILPYKKLQYKIPKKSNISSIQVCKKGFALDEIEFLYSEIESFDLQTDRNLSSPVTGGVLNIADITIKTKSNKTIKKHYFIDLDTFVKNLAKLIYIQSKIEQVEVNALKSDFRFRDAYMQITEMVEKEGCESL